MSSDNTSDLFDEEFGFHCRRIVTRTPLPPTPPSNIITTPTKATEPNITQDVVELDHNDFATTLKGKGVDKVESISGPSVDPSQFLSQIKSDLPKTERIRQLFLMTLKYELEKLNPSNKDLDSTERSSREKIRLIGLKAMEKISNREFDLFGSQHSGQVDTKFIYAEPSPKNEYNRKKIEQYKRLYADLEKEMEERKEAISEVYEYHAKSLDEYQIAEGQKVDLGSVENYIHLMDPDQQAFIKSFKRKYNKDEDDMDIDTPSLEEQFSDLSRNITELRQQLNYINEHQKEAGKQANRIMKDLSIKLERDTLSFPALPNKSAINNQNSAEQKNMELRMKKRRMLGLDQDNEMDAKATFEFLRLLSELHQ